MITIDRSSATPIFEQVAKQIRYLIARGHFDPRQNLPSTRSLAGSVGISFHTVRKAYQSLEEEGVVQATVGSGYRIADKAPLSRSERIERGAAILGDSLQQLVALGLTESEIEYLIDEQLGLLETTSTSLQIVFVSASLELAELCAGTLSRSLQRHVESRAVHLLPRSPAADYIVTEYRDVTEVRRLAPRSDVVGISTHIAPEALDPISRLLNSETLGLLTRDVETIRYLSDRIKRDSGFGGQIVATAALDDGTDLSDFFRDADLIGYTPGAARRAFRIRRPGVSSVAIRIVPDHDAIAKALELLPD